jgi:hypothetical protein
MPWEEGAVEQMTEADRGVETAQAGNQGKQHKGKETTKRHTKKEGRSERDESEVHVVGCGSLRRRTG